MRDFIDSVSLAIRDLLRVIILGDNPTQDEEEGRD